MAALGTMLVSHGLASSIDKEDKISIVVLPDDSLANTTSTSWAVQELKKSLEAKGTTVRLANSIKDSGDFYILVSGMNHATVKKILEKEKIVAPVTPESLCLVQVHTQNRDLVIAAGIDERGLVYALTELADRVKCIKSERDALSFSVPVIESPASKTRSVLRDFCSEKEDKVWFYDKDYWQSYFDMLAYSRINRFQFSTGMSYNSVQRVSDGYFLFPYPFLVDILGYNVSARGLSVAERRRNLDILKFIGKETAKRGIMLQLGLWTLGYAWDRSPDATYQIDGLTDETHAAYCRDALSAILKEIPEISGLTFRVHEESGVSLGTSSFWETQFEAVANCGRKIEIDMHAKNMEEETLLAALETKQPVVVSPKFCGEHIGLPYHQASIRAFEMPEVDKLKDTGEGLLVGNRKFTRYGYADMLSENRAWDIVYRIWPGTQRFLLSGDPELFAGYGRSASFCGAKGFELCEPLHFKGRRGSGVEGGRCGYLDTSLNPHYDFEKYEYFYRLWGRLSYNPDTKSEVWRRFLISEYGNAALPIENALAQVTRVLPLFYMAHAVSANCMIYLPEIYQNSYVAKESNWPYDTEPPKTFGRISSIDPQLFQSPNECGETLYTGVNTGKYTPIEVAGWLESMAKIAKENILEARETLGINAEKPNFRRVEEDVLILIGLAEFFAAKFRCGVIWQVYNLSGDQRAAEKAIEIYTKGQSSWVKMAERAKKVYRSDISFGPGGHWMDRIPSFDDDLADMKSRLNSRKSVTQDQKERVNAAIQYVSSSHLRPLVEVNHVPNENFEAGKALLIGLKIKGKPQKVIMYFRHINQAEKWKSVELRSNNQEYEGEIPAEFTSSRFPLQYYFEIKTSPTRATLFPALGKDFNEVPYYVVHRKI